MKFGIVTSDPLRPCKAVLQPAWAWMCPACASKNFVDSVPLDLPDDERESLKRAHLGLEEWEEMPADGEVDVEIIGAPEIGICQVCSIEVPLENPSEGAGQQ